MTSSARSTELLRELDRANLFVIALDTTGTWRRLHHLFATALYERVSERDPGGLRNRHRLAAACFENHEGPAAAIRHFLAARDFADATRLIGSTYPLYLNISRRGVTVASETALIRGAFPQGDLAAGLRSARESVRLTPRDSGWRVLALSVLALWGMFVNGPTDDTLAYALVATGQGADESQPVGVMAAWATIAAIRAERGDHHLADEAVRTAVAGAERSGLERVPASGYVWALAAYADLLGGRLERAARLAEIGFDPWRDVPIEEDYALYAVWARSPSSADGAQG